MGDVEAGPALPGRAGYALVFHDNIILKEDFKDFPTTEMTFEAWISTTDFCHPGAIMSYALKTESNDIGEITRAANHFVIFDVKNVIACHDFEFIDIIPDYMRLSCHGHYNRSTTDFDPVTGELVDREGKWHHLAVTWNSQNNGETVIYIDGSVVGRAFTGRTNEIESGGAFMLGGEQDCYGGCTDPKQGFYGLMDEVRIWNIVRSQDEIMRTMRTTGDDLQGSANLVAYWKFDDPGTEDYEHSGIVADSSGRGNDLDLLVPPTQSQVFIERDGKSLSTGALTFKNNYAMNPGLKGMPTKDITIEFWARTGAITGDALTSEHYAEFLSFSALKVGDGKAGNDNGYADSALIDDAIRIERYLTEYNESSYLKNTNTNTLGSLSIHINSNRQGNGRQNDNWLDFATDWTDDQWHHIAVSWRHNSGEVKLYFDGESITPFWRAQYGRIEDKDPSNGGVSNRLAANSLRSSYGSLVLGQNQECYAGCFSPASAYDGSMANVRIWNRVLNQGEIRDNMFENYPPNDKGLVMFYQFTEEHIKGKHERNRRVFDTKGHKYLELGSVAPVFQFSTVPLSDSNGVPLPGATPGYMGYALELSDRQLLMLRNFHDFPSDAITVEFWMWSIDGCREGVPFSYAHGEYQANDNAFLIFNYQNWGIAVMEDEGQVDDHNAGFSSTDGKWHHIAVTWDSESGNAVFYDNGMPQWRVLRGKGKKIPQGGTLVIGREQDCLGGCFDSAPGATGDVQPVINLEYGPQDFYGIIEEVRIWKRARTVEEIYLGMVYDKDNGSGKENNDLSSHDPDLVAWWKFDEGSGYTVKDETGHGHTLRILSEPVWVVPRWVETCGDGLLEATEECDDGNRINGDGCSSTCEVEDGYTCTNASPSVCFQDKHSSGRQQDFKGTAFAEASASGSGTVYTNTAVEDGSSSSSHKKGSGVGTFFLTLFVFAVIFVVAFLVYRKRETIYEYAPGLRTVVNNAQDRISSAFGRGYHRYDLAAVDPEEAYVSPGFVDSQPPAANRAAGANVPYEPIRDETPRTL